MRAQTPSEISGNSKFWSCQLSESLGSPTASETVDASSLKPLGAHFLSTRTLLRYLYAASDPEAALSPPKALSLFHAHLDMVRKMQVHHVPDSDVAKNYATNFCVPCGRCSNSGIPMVWIRMKFLVPRKIFPPCGVKSTWLSLDAALQDLDSIRNAAKVVLVYDMRDIGGEQFDILSTVLHDPFKISQYKNAVQGVGFCHASRISKVVFLGMNAVAKGMWQMFSFLVPRGLKEAVEFMTLSEVESCKLTTKENLPTYLLKEFESSSEDSNVVDTTSSEFWKWDDFHAYLMDRVKTDTLLY